MKGPNEPRDEKKTNNRVKFKRHFSFVISLRTKKNTLEPLAFSPFLMGYTLQNAFDGIFSATFTVPFSSILPIHSKKK